MGAMTDTSNPILRLTNWQVEIGDQILHHNLDLTVYPGEIIGIVGGSGSGKSVLLRSIIGLLPYKRGKLELFGQVIHDPAGEKAQSIRQRWGVLFQDGALFSSLNVFDNIAFPLRETTKLRPDDINDLVNLKLRMVGLAEETGAKMPAELSGGMRKRVALARALALDPELLFLDEPTAGLDPITAGAFDRLIKQLQQNLRLTVVMITHDLDTLLTVCDRIAVLVDKKLVIGTFEELSCYDHPWIKDYFCGPRGRQVKQNSDSRL